MTATMLTLQAQRRRRWRSWLTISLLIAIIGGVALGLVAAGTRTATAFPRFVAVSNGADALVYSASGLAAPPDSVTGLSEVAQSGIVAFPQATITDNGRALNSSSSFQLSAPTRPSARLSSGDASSKDDGRTRL